MEFWGVEVKSGKSLHVKPDPDSYIHISQAALGELKNAQGNDRVVLKVKTGAFDMVVGTLSLGRCDQTALDLIFEKDFHLSHSSTGSVFFCGYKTDAVREDDSGSSESEEDELEDLAKKEAKLTSKQNGKLVPKSEKGPGLLSKPLTKPATFNSEVPAVEIKAKVKPAVADKAKGAKEKVDEDDDDDEDEDEDEDEEDEEEDSDDVMASGSDEEDIDFDVEDDSEEEESQEEELKPTGKKRSAPALQPASGGKKGKVDIAAKVASIFLKPTSGKKESPGKKPGKENISASAAGKKLGQFSCQQCNKNFTSDSALSQHKTAKHKS